MSAHGKHIYTLAIFEQGMSCEISGSHGGEFEDVSLVGYSAV
jgi:hypothetical protein